MAPRFLDANFGDLDLIPGFFGIMMEICQEIDTFTEQGLGGHATLIWVGDDGDRPIGFNHPAAHDTLEVPVGFEGGTDDAVEDLFLVFQFPLALAGIPGGGPRAPVIFPGLFNPGPRRPDSARGRNLGEVVPFCDEDTIAVVEAAGGA